MLRAPAVPSVARNSVAAASFCCTRMASLSSDSRSALRRRRSRFSMRRWRAPAQHSSSSPYTVLVVTPSAASSLMSSRLSLRSSPPTVLSYRCDWRPQSSPGCSWQHKHATVTGTAWHVRSLSVRIYTDTSRWTHTWCRHHACWFATASDRSSLNWWIIGSFACSVRAAIAAISATVRWRQYPSMAGLQWWQVTRRSAQQPAMSADSGPWTSVCWQATGCIRHDARFTARQACTSAGCTSTSPASDELVWQRLCCSETQDSYVRTSLPSHALVLVDWRGPSQAPSLRQEAESCITPVVCGVPQGSVLGPFCFEFIRTLYVIYMYLVIATARACALS